MLNAQKILNTQCCLKIITDIVNIGSNKLCFADNIVYLGYKYMTPFTHYILLQKKHTERSEIIFQA